MWTGSRTSPVGEFQTLIQHFCLGYPGKACSTAPSRRALRNTPGAEPAIQHRRFWTSLPPHLCSTDTYGSVPDLQCDPSIQHTSRHTHTWLKQRNPGKTWWPLSAVHQNVNSLFPQQKAKTEPMTQGVGNHYRMTLIASGYMLCLAQGYLSSTPAPLLLPAHFSNFGQQAKGLNQEPSASQARPPSPVLRPPSPVPRPLQTELPPPHHFKVSSHYCWTEELNGRWKRYVGLHFKLNQMLTGALKKCLSCLVVCSPQFSWLFFFFFSVVISSFTRFRVLPD